MSPEEKAQLRQLMRKKLPQPTSELFKRTSKRFSTAASKIPSIEQQSQQQKKKNKIIKKKKNDKTS